MAEEYFHHIPYNHGDNLTSFGGDRSPEKRTRDTTIAIISDLSALRSEVLQDAFAAGVSHFRSIGLADLQKARLPGGDPISLIYDIVFIVIPHPSDSDIDLLIEVEANAARAGSQLIVSTDTQGLDDVFGCLRGGFAQILVSPNRAERIIALGEALARCSNGVRELSGDDTLTLLRLSEQVSQIAQRLERLSGYKTDASAFPFADVAPRNEESGKDRIRTTRPALPDPRLIRKIIRQRQMRARFFDRDLFADPAWDMLLDLTAARAEHIRVNVSSLCIASNVPQSTALRWIGQMTDTGLLIREEDPGDRRRAFLALSDEAANAMARYFAELDLTYGRLI